MYFLDELKNKISIALNLDKAVFSYPPNAGLGDLSLACFELAKEKKISPVELANRLAIDLKENSEFNFYFFEIKAIGPYLNFFISPSYLAPQVIFKISSQKDKFGFNKIGEKRKVMLEYSNGNTHKEYHVGHLRNISYGDSIIKLLRANGCLAIPVSYINDFGIHVAKTIWNWQHNHKYQDSKEAKGYLLGQCYSEASNLLTENEVGKQEVSQIMKEIEGRSGDNYNLWQESRLWSINYFSSIYQELDIKFQKIFYESEVINEGLKLVDELIKKNILRKSQGAIIADLEEYNLGVLPVIRSDGTALYPVADLALASEKFGHYGINESIYVVDVRQDLYFKQLFKILELLGYKQRLAHLPYDFVTLPGGMMSSRTGNVVTYKELKDKIVSKLLTETVKRHADWSSRRINRMVNNLSISIIKFEMLKVGATKIITFNLDEALRFDGYTACYLQYSYARIKSIVKKAGFSFSFRRVNLKLLTEQLEKDLLIKVAKYPDLIKLAGEKYDPSEIAKYLFELSQMFNDYYHNINILKSETNLKLARLSLINAVDQVILNGCNILGLKISKEM